MEWSPNTEYWAQIITELERKSYPPLISAHTSYPVVVLPYCWLQTIHLSIISHRDSVLLDRMLSSLTTTVINQMLGFSAPCSLHRGSGRVLFSQSDVMYASYKQSPWKKQNIIINWKLYVARNQQTELSGCFCWFLAWHTLQPWRWKQYVPPKHQTLSKLQNNILYMSQIHIPTSHHISVPSERSESQNYSTISYKCKFLGFITGWCQLCWVNVVMTSH
jgi:hypothetical protein